MERRKSTVNAPKTGARGAEAEARRMHLGLKSKAACAGTYWGAVMQCLACRADNKMLLMDVLRDDTIKVPVIEHQIYMCSACRHIARRLVFRRTQMPVTHLPAIAISIDKFWKERVTAPRTWGNAVEKFRSRQINLKERAAAAKTAGWTKAVEKLRAKQAALAEQAASRHAEPVRAPEAPSEL
jgi:hypothetical protein